MNKATAKFLNVEFRIYFDDEMGCLIAERRGRHDAKAGPWSVIAYGPIDLTWKAYHEAVREEAEAWVGIYQGHLREAEKRLEA